MRTALTAGDLDKMEFVEELYRLWTVDNVSAAAISRRFGVKSIEIVQAWKRYEAHCKAQPVKYPRDPLTEEEVEVLRQLYDRGEDLHLMSLVLKREPSQLTLAINGRQWTRSDALELLAERRACDRAELWANILSNLRTGTNVALLAKVLKMKQGSVLRHLEDLNALGLAYRALDGRWNVTRMWVRCGRNH
jgi:DNA-binding transcriptional ArsR family regulator